MMLLDYFWGSVRLIAQQWTQNICPLRAGNEINISTIGVEHWCRALLLAMSQLAAMPLHQPVKSTVNTSFSSTQKHRNLGET